MSEWIKIEDKLPDIQGQVLVCWKRKYYHPVYSYGPHISICMYTYEFKFALNNVTHWMPLPELPI